AFLYLVANAARRARHDVEQLGLIGEVHLLIDRAVAKTEHVVQLPHGIADAGRAQERSVVNRTVVLSRTTHDDKLRCGCLGELDETIISPIALHRHVESWTK